ncbi:MAG TPA: AAA family ATPase [bacterium]|nr:AAA family ATPase [bacterium]
MSLVPFVAPADPTAPASPAATPAKGVSFLPIRDLLEGDTPPVEWLIPGFLSRGSLIAFAGEPGTGKSVFSYSLALALTTGTPFLGFEATAPKKVLYFDQENSYADCVQYLRWAWHGAACPDPRLIEHHLAFAQFQLGGNDWPLKMAEAVELVQPDLIVVDTATPSFNVQDENDNGEAGRIINTLRRIMALSTPTAACFVLKHAKIRPEDGKYTLRGAKAWEGQVDGILFQTKKAGRRRKDGLNNTTLTPAKVRAFGLREPLHVNPTWTRDRVGLRLERVPEKEPDSHD